ncbi:hypothetical protein FHK92_10010 [Pseudomonas brassicacearum subsp. neoaurantiaca]|uniref:Uncharacterized protein n=1 Tax=Pseudomonas brassicacearum subsp. neoaurantiaca TaxID=494916 RepID=A0A7V8UC04_9PSED|nr:hypothetical protein [Pseudomonas brassicacearum subsp. neoaurantiaca]
MAQGASARSYAKVIQINIRASVARELAPAGLHSRPKFLDSFRILGAASPPSGSKLPRHRDVLLRLARVDVIQRAIGQQSAQFDQLQDAQGDVPA